MTKLKLCQQADLDSGQAKKFSVDDHLLALVKIGEAFYCLDDTCSHGAFSLSEGEVDADDFTLECPKHGSLFDLNTGEALTLPAIQPVACYEVFLEQGEVLVELPKELPKT